MAEREPVNVGSLFSGIGGMDHGLAAAGHRHVFFCESDPWRREVLAARWPGVPIYEDVRDFDGPLWQRAGLRRDGRIDLLCGGFPCQDLSVAGRRAGLAGDRSGLFFEFARIIDTFRPGWVLVENVPGLLSSNGGRDFGVVLESLAELGYGVAWRVLDSRFFGVPQRRRRVFIVGAFADGDPRAAAGRAGEVLAVGSRCPGHPPAGADTRPDVAVSSLSGLGSGGPDDNDAQGGRLIAETLREHPRPGSSSNGQVVASPLVSRSSRGNAQGNSPGHNADSVVAFHVTQDPISGDVSPSMSKGNKQGTSTIGVAYPLARRGREGGSELELGEANVYNALRAGDGGSSRLNQLLDPAMGVRRLTPRECERLQGLPDDWTRLDDKTPDSRRYSGLGDAVTANVAEWIGGRFPLVPREVANA